MIELVEGDTGRVPYGTGTFGSRSMVIAGSAIVMAADKIIAKARRAAAHLLEAAENDVEHRVVDGRGEFRVAGTDRRLDLGRGRARGDLRAQPAAGHGAGAARERVLRPGEPHLVERRAGVRGRDRPGDRRDAARLLRLRRRHRHGDQSDGGRGPGARRRRAGHRPGDVRRARTTTARRASSSPARSWTTPCRAPTTLPAFVSETDETPAVHATTRSARRAAASPAPSARRPRSPARCSTRCAPLGGAGLAMPFTHDKVWEGHSRRAASGLGRRPHSPTSTMAITGPPPCGPWCIASTETNTAGSPIAAAATPPTAAFEWR